MPRRRKWCVCATASISNHVDEFVGHAYGDDIGGSGNVASGNLVIEGVARSTTRGSIDAVAAEMAEVARR